MYSTVLFKRVVKLTFQSLLRLIFFIVIVLENSLHFICKNYSRSYFSNSLLSLKFFLMAETKLNMTKLGLLVFTFAESSIYEGKHA